MKYLLTPTLLAAVLLTACTSNPEVADPLEGVWKVVRIVDLDANAEEDPGNMHYMITDGHIMTVGGKEERPIVNKTFAKMTHEEVMSQLPAGGGFMNYVIKDGKIHRTTKFAMSELFEGKLIITEYEVDNTTLVFPDDHHPDGHVREWHMVRLE